MNAERSNGPVARPPAKPVDTFLRLVLLGGLLLWCVLILAPFTTILLWAVILSVTLFPLYGTVSRWLGGRGAWAAALIVVVGVSCIAVPGYFLGKSLMGSVGAAKAHFSADELEVPQLPAEWYAEGGLRGVIASKWPTSDGAFAALVKDHADDIKGVAKSILRGLAGFAKSMLLLIIAIIVAGVLFIQAESGSRMMESLLDRLMGGNGAAMVELAAGTIRQVAKGILGVAVLQAALFALGVFVAGIPAAGLLTMIALMLCIIQLGAGPIAIPVLIYAWATMEPLPATLLTIWMVAVMISDNILKPILLGRGASVPTLVIFLGAIGGFILSGFIGLFTGAVVLSIGYRLADGWMNHVAEDA